jgi:hypothetical protein
MNKLKIFVLFLTDLVIQDLQALEVKDMVAETQQTFRNVFKRYGD